jgi:hypothetical protein
VFVDEDRDVVAVVDGLNVSRSNESYTLDMQGHTPLVYSGNRIESAEIVVGPDKVSRIGREETLTSISLDPKLEEMRDSRTLQMRELAVTRRNSADAYSVEPSVVQSGVSRAIANAPHRQMLEEQRILWRRIEEESLLPLLAEVSDLFGDGVVGGDGVTYSVEFRAEADYEEPEARDRRLQGAVDSGWISPAAAAVRAGYYASVADAVGAGLSGQVRGASMPSSAIDDAVRGIVARTPEPAADGSVLPDVAAVADTALNGAQVASLLEIVDRVASKGLPPEAARALIVAGFPMIDGAIVDRIIGSLRGFSLPAAVDVNRGG